MTYTPLSRQERGRFFRKNPRKNPIIVTKPIVSVYAPGHYD